MLHTGCCRCFLAVAEPLPTLSHLQASLASSGLAGVSLVNASGREQTHSSYRALLQQLPGRELGSQLKRKATPQHWHSQAPGLTLGRDHPCFSLEANSQGGGKGQTSNKQENTSAVFYHYDTRAGAQSTPRLGAKLLAATSSGRGRAAE